MDDFDHYLYRQDLRRRVERRIFWRGFGRAFLELTPAWALAALILWL